MNCPKCNSNINQGENFCKECGYNINQFLQQSNYNQTSTWNTTTNETKNSLNINNNTSYLNNKNQEIKQGTTQNQIQFQNYRQVNDQNQHENQKNIINQEIPTKYRESNKINSPENSKELSNQIYNENINNNKIQQINQMPSQNNQRIPNEVNSNKTNDEEIKKNAAEGEELKKALIYAIILQLINWIIFVVEFDNINLLALFLPITNACFYILYYENVIQTKKCNKRKFDIYLTIIWIILSITFGYIASAIIGCSDGGMGCFDEGMIVASFILVMCFQCVTNKIVQLIFGLINKKN